MAQNDVVRAHLNKHGVIDPITAFMELGIYRLAARIYDLRETGVRIHTAIDSHGAAKYRLISNGVVQE